jgi:hypothetical protein
MQGLVTREDVKQMLDRRAHARCQQRTVRILQRHLVAAWMVALAKDDFQRTSLQMRPDMVDAGLRNAQAG